MIEFAPSVNKYEQPETPALDELEELYELPSAITVEEFRGALGGAALSTFEEATKEPTPEDLEDKFDSNL